MIIRSALCRGICLVNGLKAAAVLFTVICTFALVPQSVAAAGPWQINVINTLTRAKVTISASPADTVEAVKGEVTRVTGLQPWSQSLIFAGQRLQDGRTLADYRVTNGSTLFLTQIVGSGGPDDPPILVPGDPERPIPIEPIPPSLASLSTAATAQATRDRVTDRLGGPDAAGTGVTVSTSGGTDLPTVWIDGGLVTLFGAVTGQTNHITLGADTDLPQGAILGGYVALDTASIGALDSSGTGAGLYLGVRLAGGWTLAAQAGVTRTEYALSGAETAGLRHSTAIALSGATRTGRALFTTTLALSGFDETVPSVFGPTAALVGDRMRQAEASVEITATGIAPLGASGIIPAASLTLGHQLALSDLFGRSTESIASLTIGASRPLGHGTLAGSATVSAIGSGVNSASVTLGYSMAF